MYVPCSGKFSRGSVFTDVHRCATTFMYNHVYFVNLKLSWFIKQPQKLDPLKMFRSTVARGAPLHYTNPNIKTLLNNIPE